MLKTVSTANGLVSPTFSGNVTLSDGNLIVSNGKGIDFSATPGTGTSELLNDYEEGTWTPDQGAGLTVVGAFSSAGTYTKIGRQVTVIGSVSGATSVAVGGGTTISSNLPFAAAARSVGASASSGTNVGGTSSVINSSILSTAIAATPTIYFSVTYFV